MRRKKKALGQAAAVPRMEKQTVRACDTLTLVRVKVNLPLSVAVAPTSGSVAVSKRGGYIVYLLSSANAGEVKITEKQAIENARKFLENNGYLYMEESYYSTDDGICTVNFALNEYGVTCYPDLIKVSVSLDSGNIVSYDASGFIMNHTARQFDEPKISEDEARKSVSPLLQVMSSKRAVIPTSYETEQDTYEFNCKSESGQEFLVYIDTETGFEDDILILLYSDNGILTK